MKIKLHINIRRFLLLFGLLYTVSFTFGQKIRVQGKIVDDQQRPLAGVLVIDYQTKEVLAASDDDGLFSVLIQSSHSLRFESVGAKSKVIPVKGRPEINVSLETEEVRLPDVEVVSKIVNKVVPEPTDIEIKGNYFHLRTRVRVPKQMARTNTRLIIQPFIHDVTESSRNTLSPLVINAREYALTQQRMYSYDISKDPLSPYFYQKDKENNTDLVPYHDSIYVENQQHDFRAEVKVCLEDYNKVFYADSFIIAKGTVNPLRFFDYQMQSVDLTDSAYIPKPVLQLRNDKGEVKLSFPTNVSTIDMNLGDNRSEIAQLKDKLALIEYDPNSTLQSFSIRGVASPDGRNQANLALANARMNNAVETILSQISSGTRQYLNVKTDAKVATWSQVADLMEQDSLPQAADIRKIVSRENPERQNYLIKKLPYYKSLLVAKYLPLLRKVEYEFEYSLYRALNNEEIKSLYVSDPSQLTRYEYYRMFEMTSDTAQLRMLYNQSLKLYPKFLLAANRLAQLNLLQRRPDESVLKPFVNKDAPKAAISNQILTYIQLYKFKDANDLLPYLGDDESLDDLRALVKIFNGDYQLGYERFGSQGGLNEVLLLLAMKRNKEAFEKAQALPENIAINEYIKAVAANRLDKVGIAIVHLENAFALDPHLKEVASIDGDVNDLLDK